MKFAIPNPRAIWVVGLALSTALASIVCATEEPTPTVTPTPMPPIVVDIGMTANTVMAPVNIEFEAKDFTDGASYFWDFGDGNSAAGITARHTYLDAGTFAVKLTASRGDETEIAESTITVQPGDAGWLILNADALEIEGGETFQFDAEAFDHLGNPVLDPDLVWHADPATGSIDQNGLFTPSNEVGSAPEGVRVDFTRGNFTANYVIPVSVVYGPPTELLVTPEVIDTRVTWAVDMNAEVLDQAGHVLEDAEIVWEVLRPGDEIDQTGHYTPNETISSEDASLVLVTGTVGDVSIEQIIKGIVRPGILDHVQVEGNLWDLKSGDQVQLTAVGYDRFGHELELDELRWEVEDPQIGSFSADGLFTAGRKSGLFPENTVRVRGVLDGVEVFTSVPIRILPSTAVAIEFWNEFDSVPAGSSSPIPLMVLDENGNSINDVDVLLEVTQGGRLNANFAFAAGFEPGMYEDAIIARVEAGNAGNEALLQQSMDIEVRQRSSDFLAVDIVGPRGGVVYMINLATGDLVPVSSEIESNESTEDSPAWWPDGSRLAYSSDANGNREIWDIDPFTNDVRLLVSADNDLTMPAISPDGNRIAFVERSESATNVYVADFEFDEDGEISGVLTLDDAQLLSQGEQLQHLFPRWSPDSDLVMFTTTFGNGRLRTTVVDAVQNYGTVLVEADNANGLDWHPDGQRILISGQQNVEDGQENLLLLANLSTGEVDEVDVGGLNVGIASISPDGSEISFVDEEEGVMWLMDMDGTGRRRALGPQFQTTVTAWRPQPLQLPTPVERQLGSEGLTIPTGKIDSARHEDETFGTLGPYQVLIETTRGDVRIDLYNHLAPVTVENFLNLAKAGYYDGQAFHTVDVESAVFGGSALNAFGGTAGYYIPSEFHPEALHDAPGTISMVSKIVNGGSSEFVFALEPKSDWDAYVDGEMKDCADPEEICYAVFGRVIEGLDVLMTFEQVDALSTGVSPHRILSVTVEDGT